MNEQTPNKIEVELQSLIELAVEHWRLSSALGGAAGAQSAPARHALRRISDFLKLCELEARSLDGMVSDGGLAARVIDVVEDPALAAGSSIVEETLSPLVLWRGKVIRQAEVVIRRGSGKSAANAKGAE
jgi:hypothetical protein